MSKKKKIYNIIGLFITLMICLFLTFTLVVVKNNFKLDKFRENYNPISINNMREGYNDIFKQIIMAFESNPNIDLNSQLESYYINVDANEFNKLTSNLPESGDEEVNAYIQYEGKTQKVNLRLRGDNTWHWLYPQLSYRIKTKKDQLINGVRKFNFVNSREKTVMIDYLEYKLANKMEILTAKVEPIRLFINNKFAGVYLNTEQTDESMLRNHNKLPSNLYVGEQPGIWEDASKWEKFAEYNVMEIDDFSDLETLIDVVNSEYDRDTFNKLGKILDIDKYLRWYVYSEISQSQHTDSVHNNKLYFDPSSGKFEPIAWDAFGFSSHASPKIKLNVPLNKLNYLVLRNPIYVDEVNKQIYKQLEEQNIIDYLINEVSKADELIKEDVYADRYKDYVQFVDLTQNSRPYTNTEFDESVTILKEWLLLREKFLMATINDSNLNYTLMEVDDSSVRKLVFGASGNSGSTITKIVLGIEHDDFKGSQLVKDTNLNGILDSFDEVISYGKEVDKQIIFDIQETLYPGRTAVENKTYRDNMNCELQPSMLKYNYFIKFDGDIKEIQIEDINVINSVTQKEATVKYVESLEIKESNFSIHPWSLIESEAKENIVYSEGEHIINSNIVINKNSTITIKQGAILKFNKGVSMFVYGKLNILGAQDKPVVFTAIDKNKPWGVLAIQGYNTDYKHDIQNAIFEYGGLESRNQNTLYTGMVSAYNTNVSIENTDFIANTGGDDTFNAKNTYVYIDHCRFLNTFMDSVDLDYSDGIIQNCYFNNSGNDALDLMTSTPIIRNNYIENAGDKGISVGENSRPIIFNNVLVKNNIGIQVKDMSYPKIINNHISENQVGIHLYKKNERYGGGGQAYVINSVVTGNKVLDYECRDNSSLLLINSNVITGEGDGVEKKSCTSIYISTKDFEEKNYLTLDINSVLYNGGTKLLMGVEIEEIIDMNRVPIGLINEVDVK